jgi:hypothetical protein
VATVKNMSDPEDVTQLRKADLAEVEVDETPDDERPRPLEANPADVAEQRIQVETDDDETEPDLEY